MKKPNLFVIHCDELNFRTLGCYRDTLSEDQSFMWGKDGVCNTQYIDAIAKEGAILSKCYVATPVCSPSRASFMTGKYPQNTNVTGNHTQMKKDIITFGHTLSNWGYETGYAGKWHLEGKEYGVKDQDKNWSVGGDRGFKDHEYMFNDGHFKRIFGEDGERKCDYWSSRATDETYVTDYLTDKSLDFIDKNKDKSFAYMLSIPDPHTPHEVRPPYRDMFKNNDFKDARTKGCNIDPEHTQLNDNYANSVDNDLSMHKYLGMLKCIDENVGRIIRKLKDNDLYNDTIIVFTSDHGSMLGEHSRKGKATIYEGSAKVPFLIRYPKEIRSGTQIDHAMNTVDFMPTIFGLMGINPTRKEWQGRDMSSVIKGEILNQGDDIVFLRGYVDLPSSDFGWLAAITPRYKLLVDDKSFLIDMEEDPDETQNFIDDPKYKNVIRFLSSKLLEYGIKYKDPKIHRSEINDQIHKFMDY